MLIIPSIDLRGGKCVRLVEGKLENEIVYSEDPVFVAKLFKASGVKRIHIVDIDGAFKGRFQNFEVVKEIRESIDIEIDFGGGIRNMDLLKMVFDAGIDKAVLGTAAFFKTDFLKDAIKIFGKERICVSVDEKDGNVCVSGWKEKALMKSEEFIKEIKDIGVEEIIFTQVSRDGTLKGINFERIKEVIKFSKPLRCIIAGGVASCEDLEKLKKISPYGVIIGRAIYDGLIDLKESVRKYQN